MKLLSVNYPQSKDILFCVGELRMIQLHNRGLLSSNWVEAEAFMNFCASTIRLAFDNLVMNKVLACTIEAKEVRTLFVFRHVEVTDYLSLLRPELVQKRVGYLEKKILEAAARPGCTASDCIYNLFNDMLGKERYTDPGKVIITQILFANLFDYWLYETKNNFLFNKHILSINTSQANDMVNELNKIARSVTVERNSNREFRFFSERLQQDIYKELDARKKTDDY